MVLRPETLPEELRAVCFEEYDPEYSGPVKQLAQAQGKSGFGTLFIKLYFHIAQAAEDILGEGLRSVKGWRTWQKNAQIGSFVLQGSRGKR